MNWKLKALIQKTLQSVPGGKSIHYQLQKMGGGLRNFENECARKVDDWRIMMEHLTAGGIRIEGATVMEIGTGWYPTFPMCLYLVGARKIYSFDLNSHQRPDLTERCLQVIGRNLAVLSRFATDESKLEERYNTLVKRFAETRNIGVASDNVIECRAPADASKTGLGDGEIDLVFSNSVLEHIHEDVIGPIMNESLRILRNGGHCFHSVNCGDHYAYIDQSISQLNYLQYSHKEWKLWSNDFLYQNRLRAKDFIRMVKDAGFEVTLDTSNVRDYRMKQLAEIRVAECFASYTPEELCLTTVDLIGRKRAADQ